MIDNTMPGHYRAQAMAAAVRDELVESLVKEMAGMTIIDSQEHLPREEELLAEPPDIFTRLFGVIGNQYPNTNLNLCWTHQGSPYMAEHMISEWIDMVPSNKIIGFGGDVSAGPYKVYGALCLARENIARALAVRIGRGQMTEERAVDVCRTWLYDNPRRIYGLS